METAVDRVAAELADPRAARWFRAPGRVNLMGDHTDYNEGFVLPMAIQLETVLAVTPREDGRVRIRSLDEGGAVDVAADGSDEPRSVAGWGRYVAGVVRVLAARGRSPVGVDGVVASTVPVGSGLSSSAALEVSVALALCDAGGLQLGAVELAVACQEAEHAATGLPSGVMDQLASAAAEDGSALLIDCRDLAIEAVRVPAGFAALVVHSGVPRELEGSEYADRANACRRLAESLGLRSLRDASLEQVAGDALGRHVVTENRRVHESARALAAGDLRRLGGLFDESHASLRDDYAVSTPELDALVEALRDAGAYGARLTGAGFGGAVVAACDAARADAVAARALPEYRRATGRRPTAWSCRAVAGGGRL
jgi:galactokinase